MPDDQPTPGATQTAPSLVGGPAAAADPQLPAEPTPDELRAALASGASPPTTPPAAVPVDAADPLAPDGAKDVGTKLHMGGVVPLQVTSVGPFAGAETFDDYDRWLEGAREQDRVDSLTAIFDGLLMNIRNDPELKATEKARRIGAVAATLGDRIDEQNSSHRDEDEKALDDPASESFWFEAEDFSFTFQRDQGTAAEKAATKREGSVLLKASDFADVPDAEKPSTWKLPLVRGASGSFDLARIGDAITAMQPSGFRGNRVQLGSSKNRVASRISAAIGRASGDAKRKTALRERLGKVKSLVDPGSLTIFKDVSGAWRWTAIHSNEYRDREGEAFHKDAHDEFVQWVDADKGERMPELRVWHIPGSRLGVADLVDHTTEGFMVASGTFDPDMEHAAKALADRDDLGCSHGFWFDPAAFHGGVYHRYRSFEVSVLPRDRAANEATGFIAGKEVPVMDPEKKAYLVSVGGDAYADAIETGLTALQKDAEEKGLNYKEYESAIVTAVTSPATKEGEPAPDASTAPQPAAGSLEAVLEPLARGMASLAGTVKQIGDSVVVQAKQLEALSVKDDERIAEAFRPRFDPAKGYVASEEDAGELSDKSKKAVEKDLAGGVPEYLAPYINEDGTLKALNAGPAPAVPAGAPA